MAYKVLGQVAPSATTATTLYTVPSAKSAVCSTLTVCNRAGTSGSYRISVRPAGAALSNEHYVIYDTGLAANSTDLLTMLTIRPLAERRRCGRAARIRRWCAVSKTRTARSHTAS